MARYAKRIREHTALVLGSDIAGSAVAHALCGAGWDVVLIDDIDPPGPWRGMSFVNAWYVGSAELDDVAACFCASVKSIPTVLNRRGLIAATSWSWQGVAGTLAPDVLVDTRATLAGTSDRSCMRAPDGLLTIGCGSAYVSGEHVDLSIAVPPNARAASQGVLRAPRAGRMRSQFRIGEAVAAGEPIGDINGALLLAPVNGMLRGLTARGARVAPGQIVADIEPLHEPASCYGIDPWAAAVAARVLEGLEAAGLGPDATASSSAEQLREPM